MCVLSCIEKGWLYASLYALATVCIPEPEPSNECQRGGKVARTTNVIMMEGKSRVLQRRSSSCYFCPFSSTAHDHVPPVLQNLLASVHPLVKCLETNRGSGGFDAASSFPSSIDFPGMERIGVTSSLARPSRA
jgi:hypothetical protein